MGRYLIIVYSDIDSWVYEWDGRMWSYTDIDLDCDIIVDKLPLGLFLNLPNEVLLRKIKA